MMSHCKRLNPLVLTNLYKASTRLKQPLDFVSRRYIQEFARTNFDNTLKSEYVLVLPEPTNQEPSSNELLRLPKQNEPEIDFTKIDVETVFKGLSHTICSFDDFITDFNNSDIPYDKPIKDVLRNIESHLVPMDSAFNLLSILLVTKNGQLNYREISRLIERYHEARQTRFESNFQDYFNTFSGTAYNKLNLQEKSMVRIYRELNVNVAKHTKIDDETHRNTKKALSRDISVYRYNLLKANQQFSHTIDDPDLLSMISTDFDDTQDLHHKQRTPLTITTATYHKFMRICPDRFIRQAIWSNRNKLCSPKGLPSLNNMPIITSIRANRKKIAQFLGYRTHLDRRLFSSMAQSKQKVLEALASLNQENLPKVRDRLQELNDYASDNLFEDPHMLGIQEYDVDYWAHKYRYDIVIGRPESELRTFFPMDAVMAGIQNFFKNYFNITITEDPQHRSKLGDQQAKLFKVIKADSELLGHIISDPYHRNDKLLTDPTHARLRAKSQLHNCLPLRLISTSFKKDVRTGKINLGLIDVINLFYCYSTVIQRLLYNSEYYELNLCGTMEPDVVNLFPYLCMSQVLMDHRIIQSCSDRGRSKPIDMELATRIVKALTYFKCFDNSRDMYLAHLDIDVHTVLGDIRTSANEIHKIYSLFTRTTDNYDYCSIGDIFTGPNDGLQYTNLWSKQLASFCLSKLLPEQGSKNLASVDVEEIRNFNTMFIDEFFGSNDVETRLKLQKIVGKSFEPSKAGLDVLVHS